MFILDQAGDSEKGIEKDSIDRGPGEKIQVKQTHQLLSTCSVQNILEMTKTTIILAISF